MSDKQTLNTDIKNIRFKKLIDDNNLKYRQMADILGCDTSLVTKKYNGDRQITLDDVVKLAKHFNVSSDYLLGLTNVANKLKTADDVAVRMCCDYTNINKINVKSLNKQKNTYTIDFINDVITCLIARSNYVITYFEKSFELNSIFALEEFNEDKIDILENKISTLCDELMIIRYRLSRAFEHLLDNENFADYESHCEGLYRIRESLLKLSENNEQMNDN